MVWVWKSVQVKVALCLYVRVVKCHQCNLFKAINRRPPNSPPWSTKAHVF